MGELWETVAGYLGSYAYTICVVWKRFFRFDSIIFIRSEEFRSMVSNCNVEKLIVRGKGWFFVSGVSGICYITLYRSWGSLWFFLFVFFGRLYLSQINGYYHVKNKSICALYNYSYTKKYIHSSVNMLEKQIFE